MEFLDTLEISKGKMRGIESRFHAAKALRFLLLIPLWMIKLKKRITFATQ